MLVGHWVANSADKLGAYWAAQLAAQMVAWKVDWMAAK